METSDGERSKGRRLQRSLTWAVSSTCVSREGVVRIVEGLSQAIETLAVRDLDREEDFDDAAEDDERP